MFIVTQKTFSALKDQIRTITSSRNFWRDRAENLHNQNMQLLIERNLLQEQKAELLQQIANLQHGQ